MLWMAMKKEVMVLDESAPVWRKSAGELMAGGTAGACVEAVLYPLDTVKTRLQAARTKGGWRALVSSGGGKGLYAGLMGNLAGVFPASALFLAAYEPMKKKMLHSLPKEYSAVAHLTAAAGAGVVSSLVRVPTEVIKQRMQTGQFKSAASAAKEIVRKEGIRKGMYAGYGAFLLRDLPFDAVEFLAYEQMKIGYRKFVGGRELRGEEVAAIGALAGAVTGTVTTPLDVIKTRLMVQGSGSQYKGVLDCAATIVRDEGPGALMKGVSARVGWITLGGCVFFTCLEKSKEFYAPKKMVALDL